MIKYRQRYDDYLQSNHWKSLRKKALSRDGHRCAACYSSENLHVHHLRYRHLYDVTKGDLVTLCANCHNKAHSSDHPIKLLERKFVYPKDKHKESKDYNNQKQHKNTSSTARKKIKFTPTEKQLEYVRKHCVTIYKFYMKGKQPRNASKQMYFYLRKRNMAD